MRISLLFSLFLLFGSSLLFLNCHMKDLSNINVLSLGDSYTIGESVQENDRWSVQLARLLRSRSTDVNNPTIIARTGWTTAELNEAIIASGNKQQYDLVSLMIGVNNQYRGQPIDRYRTEFRQLVQVAVHYARNQPSHVVVLSIPDWGASPFAASRDRATIAKQIDEFNAVASQVCAEAGVTFIDITPLTRQAAGDASQFAADGLHYSGKQMKKWAEKALPIVEKILN
ncbi:SGNH/GDSL hydrolase family protein [Fibrella sp. HMF5405]|uniref:SGNH/GDSL hydrolase family protein n=2 Tax=Fibrella forsythiae TaxID=2817061 RepID=A0ABS3JH78_9BACT|nr:SGNH/GDSL hydrolase family protein [Fibrella forsythiae]